MGVKPIPIAVQLPDGLVLRGHEWSIDGPAVVFVHDFGDDLDSWESVTTQVSAAGFRVISIELRGHGLSDGEPDADMVFNDLAAALGEITASFGPVALVAYGSVAECLLFMDSDSGAPVQVMVSPLPSGRQPIDWRMTRKAMRLVLSTGLAGEEGKHVEFIYPRMKGQRMQVSGASKHTGPALLMDQPQLVEHLTMFLRRYLTGYHLSWIADQADKIEAVRVEHPPAGG